MPNSTISQVEVNGTTYDLLDANTLSAVSALNTRVSQLEDSVSDTGWLTLATGIKYRIRHGVCYFMMNAVTIPSGTTIIATLPDEAKPAYTVNPFARYDYELVQCWITTAGNVYVASDSATIMLAGFGQWPV